MWSNERFDYLKGIPGLRPSAPSLPLKIWGLLGGTVRLGEI